tara:strand:- start:163 stop:432 length:270 start_codon:yes stop_codon:yes gene_type:complete
MLQKIQGILHEGQWNSCDSWQAIGQDVSIDSIPVGRLLVVADLHRLLPRRLRLAACDLLLFLFAVFPLYIYLAFNYRLQTANLRIQENS